MGPVLVVVGHGHLENTLEVLLIQNQHPVETFRADRTHKALAGTPLACGARNGVRTISILSARNTSSNRSVNFWSRSRIKKRTCAGRSPSVHVTCRACCVTHGEFGVGVHPVGSTRRLPSPASSDCRPANRVRFHRKRTDRPSVRRYSGNYPFLSHSPFWRIPHLRNRGPSGD